MIDLILSFFAGAFASFCLYRIRMGPIQQKIQSLYVKLDRDRLLILKNGKEKIFQDEQIALKKISEKEGILEKSKKTLQDNEKKLQESLKKQENELLQIVKSKKKIETEHLLIKNSREQLLKLTEEEILEDLKAELLKKATDEVSFLEKQMLEERIESVEYRAKDILITTMQRLSMEAVMESSTTQIPLLSDEIKRKIVGKEGRNIKTFEMLTGTSLLLDQAPQTATLSCFDPLRREVAKRVLNTLINHGKIHPSIINEVYQEKNSSIEDEVIKRGEQACSQVGITKLHLELIKLLGKLHFRYSLGQNVLQHSIEVAQIMELIASEMELNTRLSTRIGLLHDIGKSVEAEKGYSHASVGAKLAKTYGEREEVINGILCHHNEAIPKTLEAKLLGIADRVSAGKPGARREQQSVSIKRFRDLEKIALNVEGVEKAYILQAGKEMCVIVSPEKVGDKQLKDVILSLRKSIEEQASIPGKLKITVKREQKLVDYTHCK